MHAVARKLLALAALAPTIAGCHEVCSTPARDERRAFVDLEESAPQLAAKCYATLGLKSGTITPTRAECAEACGEGVTRCEVHVDVLGDDAGPRESRGEVVCTWEGTRTCHEELDPIGGSSCPYGCGRLPARVRAPRSRARDPLARHLAETAALEALAVCAFAELARDLAAIGEARFAARLDRARADERRHATLARALLRSRGARPPKARRPPRGARTLEAIARHNAVEGCVRETFGALSASVQARRAQDPALRAFYRAIAPDELRHATLSWCVHAALMPRLDAAARARVVRAQRRAIEALARAPVADPLVRFHAGAPDREAHVALVRAFEAAVLPEVA